MPDRARHPVHDRRETDPTPVVRASATTERRRCGRIQVLDERGFSMVREGVGGRGLLRVAINAE
jgi:hypothetical protein